MVWSNKKVSLIIKRKVGNCRMKDRKKWSVFSIVMAVAVVAIVLSVVMMSLPTAQPDLSDDHAGYSYRPVSQQELAQMMSIQSDIHYGEAYPMGVSYPVTSSQTVNEQIKSFVDSQVEQFQTTIVSSSADESVGSSAELNIDYQLSCFNEDIVSILFHVQQNGGDSSGDGLAAMTFDLNGEKRMNLSDFFREGSGYEQYLLDKVQSSLRDQKVLDKKEKGPVSVDQLQNFMLDGDQIVFYFSPGSVADSSYGQLEVSIPLRLMHSFSYFQFDDAGTSVSSQPEAYPAVTQPESPQTSTGTKQIALTFDDGPYKNTEKVLDLLDQYNAKATFFVVGNRVEYFPETIRRMVSSGHCIGNHTYSHKRLDNLSPAQVSQQLTKTNEAVKEITGGYVPQYVRPPYGFYDHNIKTIDGMPVILWTVDPGDWSLKNTQKIAQGVIQNAKDGDIVILHEQLTQSVEATEIILQELTNQGFSFVTVDQLMDK